MTDTKKAVETTVQDGQSGAATEHGEVDVIAQLAAKDAELAKAREITENYRRAALKAKGKLPADEVVEDTESIDEIVARKVQEQLLASRETQIAREKDDLIISVARENKELKLALKNRGQITSAGASSGSDATENTVKTETYWSKEQLEALKKRGIDPEKAKELAMKKK